MVTHMQLEAERRELLQQELDLEMAEKAKEKKMEEKEVAFQEGGILQSKEEIKAEAVAEVVAALALVGKYPELVKLLGGGDEDL